MHHHKLYFMLNKKNIHIKYLISRDNTKKELVPDWYLIYENSGKNS